MLTNAASTSLDKTTLQTTSPQFARLEYSLQLALGASTARIVDAQVVSNPHLTVQFEKKSKVRWSEAIKASPLVVHSETKNSPE